ncbi:coiled-coil domain-containing protein 117 isoform 1-T3 [Synchiropus picturatus]
MEWTAVHHAVAPTHELGLCAFPGHTSLAEWDLGPAPGPVPPAAQHPQPASLSGSSWEARCLRKHRRRRSADEYVRQQPSAGSWHTHTTVTVRSPQRVPGQEEETGGGDPGARRQPQPPGRVRGPAPGSGAPGSGAPGGALLPGDGGGSAEASGDRKQVSAGQNRPRGGKSLMLPCGRITLEDDDEDPDLEVEPAPRRPVLVLSDSLKEGLQRGMGDILPHTVAQSVSHSCMELVLWRPPEDPFCRRLRGSLHKQRKQQTAARQSPAPPRPPSPAPHSGEEDMEMEL